jgi:hypothetical protein
MSPPPARTGDAAPMFVPGAMTATCEASVMKVPALAARPPAGATQTIVGTLDSSRVPTMLYVASRPPPGVLRRMTTAEAPSSVARPTPSAM